MASDQKTDAIHAGEFVESIYDSIELSDPRYRYKSIFGKSTLLPQVGLPETKVIRRYLYCTVQGSKFFNGTNWIGYIAQSHNSLLLVFRGTLSAGEWWKDLGATMEPFGFVRSTQVHSGFLHVYKSKDTTAPFPTSLREQLFSELKEYTAIEDITIVGHSLGGALAMLAACDIGVNFKLDGRSVRVSAFTFGSPKVGNNDFKKVLEDHCSLQRYENVGDVVPTLPPYIPVMFPYVTVGTLHKVDWAVSPYLKPIKFYDIRKKHDLELYLHGIAMQASEYSEEDAFEEMKLDPMTNTEELSQELVGDDPHAAEELQSIKDLFLTIAWKDEQSLHKHLLDCVYVARRQQSDKKLEPKDLVDRDYALVNKWQDSLLDKFQVPEKWWVHRNRDVRQEKETKLWLPRAKRPADQPIASNPEYN